MIKEIKGMEKYFIDVSGELDGNSLDMFNYDIGMGKESQVGFYNTNNGIISFVDKDNHVYAGFNSSESEEALIKAGCAIKLEQKIMGANHLNEVEAMEKYLEGYREAENSPSILDSEKKITIHYLKNGEANKTHFDAVTNLYNIAKSEKDGEISHVVFDTKTEGTIKKLTENYFEIAFGKQGNASVKINHFKKALAGIHLIGLDYDSKTLEIIEKGLKPSYNELMHGNDTKGRLSDEFEKFKRDFELQNKENTPKKVESLDNILN